MIPSNQETFVLETQIPTFNTPSETSLLSKIISKISQFFSKHKPIFQIDSEETNTKLIQVSNPEDPEHQPLLEKIDEDEENSPSDIDTKNSLYLYFAADINLVFSPLKEDFISEKLLRNTNPVNTPSQSRHYNILADDFDLSKISKFIRRCDTHKKQRLIEVDYAPIELHKQTETLSKEPVETHFTEKTSREIDEVIGDIDCRLAKLNSQETPNTFSFKNLIKTFLGWFAHHEENFVTANKTVVAIDSLEEGFDP